MAKLVNYTDPQTQASYVGTYWRLDWFQIDLNVSNPRGTFIFRGYASKAAREAGASPVPNLEFRVYLEGDAMRAAMASAPGLTVATGVGQVAYGAALPANPWFAAGQDV